MFCLKQDYLEVEEIHDKTLKMFITVTNVMKSFLYAPMKSPFVKSNYVNWLLRFTKA